MPTTKRICYLIVNEYLFSPLLSRQVFQLLSQISTHDQIKITLVCFQRIYDILRYKNRILNLHTELKNSRINLIVLPSLSPFPFPYFIPNLVNGKLKLPALWSPLASKLLCLTSLPQLLLLHIIFRFDVVHARSYPAGYLASVFSLFTRIKVVFDPRSDFPEENIQLNNWSAGSRCFAFWKKFESNISRKFHTVCISEAFYKSLSQPHLDNKLALIHNNVDTTLFNSSRTISCCPIRDSINIDDSVFLVTYLGDMSDYGWHQPSNYLNIINSIHSIGLPQPLHFLFIVPENSLKYVSSVFSRIPNVTVRSVPFSDVHEWIKTSDAGIMSLPFISTRIGTKICEYLCCGLNILVNSNSIGSIDFMESNNMSSNYFLSDHLALPDFVRQNYTDIDSFFSRNSDRKDDLAVKAQKIFSNHSIAEKYIDLYYD